MDADDDNHDGDDDYDSDDVVVYQRALMAAVLWQQSEVMTPNTKVRTHTPTRVECVCTDHNRGACRPHSSTRRTHPSAERSIKWN